jgi:hypothetical protein
MGSQRLVTLAFLGRLFWKPDVGEKTPPLLKQYEPSWPVVELIRDSLCSVCLSLSLDVINNESRFTFHRGRK